MAAACRVAILGFGTVGASVAKAMAAIPASGLELAYVYKP